MKLSTRSRYGVRMMYELALKYGQKPLVIRDIAERQQISEKYLSKIVIPLKGARLVVSWRGARGGYVLSRDPSQITLWDIVSVLESDMTPVDCFPLGGECNMAKQCPTRDIWFRLDAMIQNFFKDITLKDMVLDNAHHFCSDDLSVERSCNLP